MSKYQEAAEVLNTRLNTYYCTDDDLKALDLGIYALKVLDKVSDKLDELIIKCEDASQRTTFETDISYYNGMVQGLKLAKKLIVEEGEK